MRFVDRYPIIVTPRLRECRDFWTAHLGFAVAFEADWFILLQAEGASLAFMSPDHPSAPPGPENSTCTSRTSSRLFIAARPLKCFAPKADGGPA